MKAVLDIKVEAKDLFKFNILQAYEGRQGFLSILLPILIFAYSITSFGSVSIGSTLVYVGIGIVFLVYVPVTLWIRANKIVNDSKNALSKEIHYEFTEEGILVSVGEESVELEWKNVYRVKTAMGILQIYTNRNNAYLLPLAQVGENYDVLSKLVYAKVEKFRVRMYKENKYTSK